MAADCGPAEQWRAALPQHALFGRLRERAPAAPRPPRLRDLLCGLGSDLLLWDGPAAALLAIGLRRLGTGTDPAALDRYQVREGLRGGRAERGIEGSRGWGGRCEGMGRL